MDLYYIGIILLIIILYIIRFNFDLIQRKSFSPNPNWISEKKSLSTLKGGWNGGERNGGNCPRPLLSSAEGFNIFPIHCLSGGSGVGSIQWPRLKGI